MDYRSHIGQDMWVAETLNFRRDGYFVEFGSLDGEQHNNTLALERELGWRGICVEPNPAHYPAVCRSRNVIAMNAAVWRSTGQTIEMVDAYGLTSAMEYKDSDIVAEYRNRDTTGVFTVQTISPNDLFARFKTPPVIDYMSLDVEGAEMDVLKAMDLKRYPIALMTVEHCEMPERQSQLSEILEPQGYVLLKRAYDFFCYHPEYLEAREGSGAGARAAYDKVCREFKVLELT